MDKNLWLGELWDEWLTSSAPSQRHADAETSGILMGMKHTHSTFTTNRLRTARRLSGKLWPLTSYAAKIPLAFSLITRTKQKPSVKFTCPREILTVPKSSRYAWAWLKGLWGSAGGLYFPKNGYYLTLIISDPETSSITRDIITLTGLSWSEHRSEFTLRNHDDIMTFLHKCGMTSGALAFDEVVMMRSVRSRANLESNYEAANIARSVRAANEQTKLARKILAAGLLDKLPGNLRDVVVLRLEHPDESLEGIGKMLSPPVKKSAVKYRWNKIQRLIENS